MEDDWTTEELAAYIPFSLCFICPGLFLTLVGFVWRHEVAHSLTVWNIHWQIQIFIDSEDYWEPHLGRGREGLGLASFPGPSGGRYLGMRLGQRCTTFFYGLKLMERGRTHFFLHDGSSKDRSGSKTRQVEYAYSWNVGNSFFIVLHQIQTALMCPNWPRD